MYSVHDGYLPCTPAFRLSQEMMAVINNIGAKCSGGDCAERSGLKPNRPRGSGKANRAERSTVPQAQTIAYLKEALRMWKRVQSPEAAFVAACKNGRKAFHFKLFISIIIFIHPTRKSNLPLAKNRRKFKSNIFSIYRIFCLSNSLLLLIVVIVWHQRLS